MALMPRHRVVVGKTFIGQLDVVVRAHEIATAQCKLGEVEMGVGHGLAQRADAQIQSSCVLLLCSGVLTGRAK